MAGIAGTPVLGAIRRIKGDDPLPGRHLGLVTAAEHPAPEESIQRAAEAVAAGVDIDRLLAVAQWSPELELMPAETSFDQVAVTIAYLEGEAFSFYYAENLERLRSAGVQLVPVDPASASELPEVDGLYIGGGFPEVHAARLGSNTEFTASIRANVDAGMPVYAECAGLMYLARELVVDGVPHAMAGVLDLAVEQRPTPQGHGYEVAVVDRDNPFFAAGTRLVGHEFHYSRLVGGSDREKSVLRVERGTGIGDNRDGISSGRVFASYLHLHAGATPGWADGFLSLAAQFAARAGRVDGRMRLKEEVMEMLRQGDSEGLERMVGENPAAIRFLQGRLWDADPEIRSRAAHCPRCGGCSPPRPWSGAPAAGVVGTQRRVGHQRRLHVACDRRNRTAVTGSGGAVRRDR